MRLMTDISDPFWLDVAERCDYATFFHTPYWRRLGAAATDRNRDATFGAILPSGTRVVYPRMAFGRGVRVFPTLLSTFAGCYGGPIADGPLSAEDWGALRRAAGKGNIRRFRETENPLAPPESAAPWISVPDFTHILHLNRDFGSILTAFSRGHRGAIAKAKKAGVAIDHAADVSEYREYYAMYEASRERWGDAASSHYPPRLFEAICELASTRPAEVRLWQAREGTRLLAGALIFYWNRHVVYWHGAAYAEFFHLRATTLLLAEAIRDACERGYLYFDFNPSGGHQGTAEFKRRFGAETKSLNRYEFAGWWTRPREILRRERGTGGVDSETSA
jgi:hypothetical protein